MCKEFMIEPRYNVPYNPRSNPTERTNQSIETMICSYVAGNHRQWDKVLPELQYAMRSAVSAVTNGTSHYLPYGHELSLDGRNPTLREIEEVPEPEDRSERETSLKQLEALRDEVQEKLQEAHERNVHRYNLRRRPAELKVGDTVWRRNFVKSKKIENFSKKLAPK